MKTLFKTLLLIFVFFTHSLTFATSEIREFSRISDVYALALELSTKTSPKSVWAIYDIDNTLLAGQYPLSTTEWFDWQLALIKENSSSSYRVARDLSSLITIHQHIFDWSSMNPLEPDTVSIVNALQEKGFHAMALTARSTTMFPAAFRELSRNGMLFIKSSAPLPKEQIYPAVGNATEPVLLRSGIMLVNGQNKGEHLRNLFYTNKISARYIIFLDDAKKNVVNMAKAFACDARYHVIAIHFTAADNNVKAFQASDKKQWSDAYHNMATLWQQLQGYPITLNEVQAPH